MIDCAKVPGHAIEEVGVSASSTDKFGFVPPFVSTVIIEDGL